MTLTRDALIGIFVLLLVLIGLFWYYGTHPVKPLPQLPAATSTPATPGPQHLEEHAAAYDIDAAYPGRTPLFESAGASADLAAVSSMKSWEESEIAGFKKNGNFDNLSPEDRAMMGFDDGRKEALSIDYQPFMGSRTASYEFTVFADTFGAHPNAYQRTFTFDLLTGAELSLADLFDGKTDYLGKLSQLARAILAPRIAEASGIPLSEFDQTYLKEGTEPTPENFQWFYFDDADFVVVFPPYQVGPWVLGRQEARIPKADLSAYLRAEYR